MPHRPWHTGNPFFGGGMYGGEEEFDLPALFAASPQLGNLSPEIAANAISSAVQQISAPASSPFQDFEMFDAPAMPSPRPSPTPAPSPAPPPPLLGGISGGMMDMPVPPVERPFLGGMGGGSAPMDMNVPIGPEPSPSAPVLTPEQMRQIGLRSALQKTGLGSVPFDPMSEVGPMGQEMLQGVPSPMNPRYDMYPSSGAMEYPVNQALAIRANRPDPATIRNLMKIDPTELNFGRDVVGMGQGELGVLGTGGGDFTREHPGWFDPTQEMGGRIPIAGQAFTPEIIERFRGQRGEPYEEFFDPSMPGAVSAQDNAAVIAANKKEVQVTESVKKSTAGKDANLTNQEANEVAKIIIANNEVVGSTTVKRAANQVKAEGFRGQGPGQIGQPALGGMYPESPEQVSAAPSYLTSEDAMGAATAAAAAAGVTPEETDEILYDSQKGVTPAAIVEKTKKEITKKGTYIPSAEEEREMAGNNLMWNGTDWVPIPAPTTYPTTTTEKVSSKEDLDRFTGNGNGSAVSSSVDIDPTTGKPFGQDTAAGANLPAGGAGGPTSLWQQSLLPYEQWQQWRMAPYGGATLAGTLRGRQALGAGYQPAYGRFLLGSGQGGYEGDPADTGPAFRQYLEGDRRGLEDVRSSYGSLGQHLGGYGGTDWSGISPMWGGLFDPEDTERYKANIISASQAALGMRPGFGQQTQRHLGNVYDAMQTQYGPEAAGKFSDWVSSAYA